MNIKRVESNNFIRDALFIYNSKNDYVISFKDITFLIHYIEGLLHLKDDFKLNDTIKNQTLNFLIKDGNYIFIIEFENKNKFYLEIDYKNKDFLFEFIQNEYTIISKEYSSGVNKTLNNLMKGMFIIIYHILDHNVLNTNLNDILPYIKSILGIDEKELERLYNYDRTNNL